MIDEYETEPVPGLPELLPEGEALLWQGAPHWTGLARHVFHARAIAFYFGLLIVWLLGSTYWTGDDMAMAAASVLRIGVVAAVALGLVALLARLTSRTTIYTITSRRVVMRYGIAMPISVNIPYTIISSANVNIHGDRTGDIALTLTGNGKLAYFHLWPHARPWHLTKTQPMLRCLAEPAMVANLLSKALSEASPSSERSTVTISDGASPATMTGGSAAAVAA